MKSQTMKQRLQELQARKTALINDLLNQEKEITRKYDDYIANPESFEHSIMEKYSEFFAVTKPSLSLKIETLSKQIKTLENQIKEQEIKEQKIIEKLKPLIEKYNSNIEIVLQTIQNYRETLAKIQSEIENIYSQIQPLVSEIGISFSFEHISNLKDFKYVLEASRRYTPYGEATLFQKLDLTI